MRKFGKAKANKIAIAAAYSGAGERRKEAKPKRRKMKRETLRTGKFY